MAKTIKTSVAVLKYIFITGEGKNQAMPGEAERMQFVATAVIKKDSEEHKALHSMIYAEWESYKKANNVKGKPGKNKHGEYMDGMRIEYTDDPAGTIDPETERVKKIPTGNITVTFKTNAAWPNGNKKVVKVKDRTGKDITAAIEAASAEWTIGTGTLGVLHGTAVGNNVGGDNKITLYLSAVQIAKLVKYEGEVIECDELDGDDLDLGDGVTGIDTDNIPDDNAPKL